MRIKKARTTVAMLSAELCLAATSTATAQDSAGTRIDAGPEGFALASEGGEWRLRLRGLVQVDGRIFADDSAAEDDTEWLLRRVRPSFEGELGERIAFRIMPDFGGGDASLVDAYIDTDIGNGVSIRAGKFKPPVGLERLQSANDLRLIERSVVTELVPNRDVGVQVSGNAGLVDWSAGLFNGVIDGRSGDESEDGNQDVAVRLFVVPLDGENSATLLGFGVAATVGDTEGAAGSSLLPSYRSPAQNAVFAYRQGADGTFADGDRRRVVPQFYAYQGPVGVLGEWARVTQDVRRSGAGFDRSASLEHEAWQLTAEWLLTGERAGFEDPGSGAVQLVSRVSGLSIDDAAFSGGVASFADPADAVRKSSTWAFGVNWFPLPGLKASAAYQQTSFEGGAANGDRPDEKVLMLRLQTRF